MKRVLNSVSRYGVDKESLLPITKYDEKKVDAHFTITRKFAC